MGHIKEPKGIDFIIKSDPITDKEQAAITEFIKNYKAKQLKKKKTSGRKTPPAKIRKRVLA